MFMKSRGKPIQYEGKTLVMGDDFPTHGATRFRLVFECCNGEWRQGVALRTNGSFCVFDRHISGNKGIVLWRDKVSDVVDFAVTAEAQVIDVKNVWDVGDGVMHSWHNGAAIIIEPVANGRRYRCNDGLADDDFDDIVFRLERFGN